MSRMKTMLPVGHKNIRQSQPSRVATGTFLDSKIIVNYDGCCEPYNPGGHGGAGCIIKRGSQILKTISLYFPATPTMSNNVAEYCGVIAALEWLAVNQFYKEDILIRGDNMMSVMQLSGKWKVRGGFYVPFFQKAYALTKQFKRIHFQWIPRIQNDEADELSKAELKKRKVNFRIQPESQTISPAERVGGMTVSGTLGLS